MLTDDYLTHAKTERVNVRQLDKEEKAVFVVQNGQYSDVQIVGIYNDKTMAKQMEESKYGWTSIHVLNERDCCYDVNHTYDNE